MLRVIKVICLTMIVFAVLCSIVLPALAAQISVEPLSQTVSKGENFTVDIYVDPEGNVTAGLDYILRFNNTLLNAISSTSGTFFDPYTPYVYGGINNSIGIVDYGGFITESGVGVTNPGIVTTITFEATANEDGVSELTFETVTLSDPDGYEISTNFSNGNVSVITGICGDVTGDDEVTMADGRQIYMHLIYGTQLDCSPWAADVTGDGDITMADGRQIYMHLIYGSALNCEV